VGASALGSPGRAGVTLDQDGTVAFDRSKFLSAFADDPEAVAALFRQGGTASSSLVAFQSATAKTRAGDYGVSVSRAATRSSVSGALLAAAPSGVSPQASEIVRSR
jgi:flagellar hook-associated protein 2